MLISFLTAIAVPVVAGVVGECRRTPGDTALSGISPVGDGVYWAVDDSGKIVKGKVELKTEADGRVTPSWTRLERFTCPGVDDPEGVVYDRADGTLWVADETGPEIWHVDPKTRQPLGKVGMPSVYRTIEKNRGIESLAIGNDGLTLWTVNEDELPGDAGSDCVRLQRFSRASVTNDWKASGQWAYPLTPELNVRKLKIRNGLAELCVTPSGELLALEREKIKLKKSQELPQFRLRIFLIGLDGATDVSSLPRLQVGGFSPLKKQCLCDMRTGNAMYEAICVGPKLQDGKDSYVLVSDGDKGCDEKIMVLTLP